MWVINSLWLQTTQLFFVSIKAYFTCFNLCDSFSRNLSAFSFAILNVTSWHLFTLCLWIITTRFFTRFCWDQSSFTSCSFLRVSWFIFFPLSSCWSRPLRSDISIPIMLLCQNPQETVKHSSVRAEATEAWRGVMCVRSVSLLSSVHNSCDGPLVLTFTLCFEYLQLEAN